MGVLELISGAETDYEFTLLQLILLMELADAESVFTYPLPEDGEFTDEDYILASESAAIISVGGEIIRDIEKTIENRKLQDQILRVEVPVQQVVEVSKTTGKKKTVEMRNANKKDKHSSKFKFSLDDFTYSVAKQADGLMLTLKQKKNAAARILII